MTSAFGRSVLPSQRRPVQWYSPPVLLQSGKELVSSADFLRNADRRDTFPSRIEPISALAGEAATDEAPLWFDFISDTGDGGSATYTVARAALRRDLPVTRRDGSATTLPEGRLLLLGGDLAYPGASPLQYQYRLLELFEMALDPASRYRPRSAQEKLLATIPQNHDWFDSVSTFCRYFVTRDNREIIGARTPQRQTYFAARLPQRWWVLGFDFALTGDLDRLQFEAFCALLAPEGQAGSGDKLGRGDAVVLIYPEPYWTRPLSDAAPKGYPRRYQRLEHLLEAHGVRIALRLAGDLHHYVRHSLHRDPASGQPSHLVTCGSGGAFLHPTHCTEATATKVMDKASEPDAISSELQHRIRVGRLDAAPGPQQTHFDSETVAYPPPHVTRALAWRAVLAMFSPGLSRPRPGLFSAQMGRELWNSNLGFALVLGLLYGVNAYVNSLAFSLSFVPDGFKPMSALGFGEALPKWLHAMVFSPFAALINLLMLVACVRIAWEGPAGGLWKLASGLLHGLAHGFLVFALYWVASHGLAALLHASPALLVSFAVWCVVTVAGMLAGGLLFGSYLALVCAVFGQLPNNTFGALAIQDHKGFLRFKLADGALHAYFVVVDKVPEEFAGWDDPPPAWRIEDEFELGRSRPDAS